MQPETVSSNGAVIRPLRASGPASRGAANRRAVARGADSAQPLAANKVIL